MTLWPTVTNLALGTFFETSFNDCILAPLTAHVAGLLSFNQVAFGQKADLRPCRVRQAEAEGG